MAGAASAGLTALGAWPGETAKVVEGVSEMSRRAAAATQLCERRCCGKASPEMKVPRPTSPTTSPRHSNSA